jgi:hypothetical protein
MTEDLAKFLSQPLSLPPPALQPSPSPPTLFKPAKNTQSASRTTRTQATSTLPRVSPLPAPRVLLRCLQVPPAQLLVPAAVPQALRPTQALPPKATALLPQIPAAPVALPALHRLARAAVRRAARPPLRPLQRPAAIVELAAWLFRVVWLPLPLPWSSFYRPDAHRHVLSICCISEAMI